ncbi:hypothetical protein Tco_1266304 [Tanacetum coccineum]
MRDEYSGVDKREDQSGKETSKELCDIGRTNVLEFEVGDRFMLKVLPWKGVIRFGKKGKLAPSERDRLIVVDRDMFVMFERERLNTPLCCDDIHDVTPRVSALAGCDRLVSEPLVIENILVMFSPTRKKSRWGTVFPTGLKRYKEPLMEPKEIG